MESFGTGIMWAAVYFYLLLGSDAYTEVYLFVPSVKLSAG